MLGACAANYFVDFSMGPSFLALGARWPLPVSLVLIARVMPEWFA